MVEPYISMYASALCAIDGPSTVDIPEIEGGRPATRVCDAIRTGVTI